jgi:hypothetical protein
MCAPYPVEELPPICNRPQCSVVPILEHCVIVCNLYHQEHCLVSAEQAGEFRFTRRFMRSIVSRQGLANATCDLSVQICIRYGLDRSIDCVAWIGVGNEWSWLHRDLPWDPPLSRRCSPGALLAKRRPSG